MADILKTYNAIPYSPAASDLIKNGWTIPSDIEFPDLDHAASVSERLATVVEALKTVENRIHDENNQGVQELYHNMFWLPLIQLRQQLSQEAFDNMPTTLVGYDEAVNVVKEILYAAIKKQTGVNHVAVNKIKGYEDEVSLVAACLADAEGQKHETHGISRVLFYADAMSKNHINPNGIVKLISQTPGKLSFDGGGTFGQVAVQMSLQYALEHMDTLPEDSALMVTMRNAHHAGRLEWILRQAARNGCNSFALFNVDGHGRTSPHGGREGRYGTNPISMGVSTGIGSSGYVGDCSSTASVEGKVRVALLNNQTVPLGVLATPDGHPTIDPAGLYRENDYDLLCSIGGEVAEHKGAMLGGMIKLLVDAATGRPLGDPVGITGRNNLVLLLHKTTSAGIASVKENAAYITSCPPKKSFTEIRLPGVGGMERLELAKANGLLKIASGTWEKVLVLHKEIVV